MLTVEKQGIIKLLIALAWADGKVDKEELEVIEALFDAFSAEKEEADELREWAMTPRTIEDVDISSLERSDLELALQYAVVLTYIDGEQSQEEVVLIDKFIKKIGLSMDEAKPILEAADHWAKQLVPEL